LSCWREPSPELRDGWCTKQASDQ